MVSCCAALSATSIVKERTHSIGQDSKAMTNLRRGNTESVESIESLDRVNLSTITYQSSPIWRNVIWSKNTTLLLANGSPVCYDDRHDDD